MFISSINKYSNSNNNPAKYNKVLDKVLWTAIGGYSVGTSSLFAYVNSTQKVSSAFYLKASKAGFGVYGASMAMVVGLMILDSQKK